MFVGWSLIKTIASVSADLIVNIKKIYKHAEEYGKMLYDAHINFDNAVFFDKEERKEIGMEANQISGKILFALDQIKEESYGWADDRFFNKQSYGKNNPLTAYLGGPFTMMISIAGVIIGGPATLIPTFGTAASYAALRSVAKGLNPTGYERIKERDKK